MFKLSSSISSLILYITFITDHSKPMLLTAGRTCFYLQLYWYWFYCCKGVLANNEVSSNEISALQSLYDSTNGESWDWSAATAGAHWDFSGDPNPCLDGWQGITCNSECSNIASSTCTISELDLPNYNLDGTLPLELHLLSSLDLCELNQNKKLSGTLPSEIGSMTNLLTLEIYDSDLTGSIPSSLGSLVLLTNLDLTTNQLTGSIPSSMRFMIRLQTLNLATNKLTGRIPSSFGSMQSLQSISLGTNKLNGTIPSELASLSGLYYMYLFINELSELQYNI